MTWHRVLFDEALTHCVHESLMSQLIADMVARGHEMTDVATRFGPTYVETLGGNPKAVTEWAIDLGGPMFLDRTIEVFIIDKISVDIPTDHVEHVARMMYECPPRTFADGSQYRKIKAWHHAFVMRPVDYDQFCRLIQRAVTAITAKRN